MSNSWTQLLREDPAAALDAVLGHGAVLGSLRAAEPEDAAEALLSDEARDGALFAAFDQACLDRLTETRTVILADPPRRLGGALQKLYDLLAVVRRIQPEQTVLSLQRDYSGWLAFFEAFVFDNGFDLRREFFRLLALTQAQAETADTTLASRRLMPLWLTVCGESGARGRYDFSYLSVGLLGLRRLALGSDFDANEDFVLQGLLRWARTQAPNKELFLREWRIIEGDFPRDPDFWAERVAAVLETAEQNARETRQKVDFPAAQWWREELDLEPHPVRNSAAAAAPPSREALEDLIRRFGHPAISLKPEIEALISRHENYARTTGDVFYLVRTACNIGRQFIKRAPDHERTIRGETAIRLADTALRYEPDNLYAWGLWRDGLTAANRLVAAELVGWETVRRYPEDPQWRTQLATLLTEQRGQAVEAAALLRQTIDLFPTNAVARTQLAMVLAEKLSQPVEAAALLRQTIDLFPTNAVARNQLAMVLADDLKQVSEAEAVLMQARHDGASDATTDSLLGKLKQGRKLRRNTPSLSPGNPVAPCSDLTEIKSILASAVARRQLFLRETGRDPKSDWTRDLVAPGESAYGVFATARNGEDRPVWPTFAMAFEAALRQADPSPLRAMTAQARPLEREMIEAALALGDGRVVAFSPRSTEPNPIEQRLASLESRLQETSPASARLLLRDFAGSLLSLAA